MKRLYILSILTAIVAASCTKDVQLNLQNGTGLLVIEGNITNQRGSYQVTLSKTLTYYGADHVMPVSGSKVIITDDAGNRDSLREGRPGVYQTSTIIGTVGRTYHLSVNSGGKQYDAYSTMNPPIAIDSIGVFSLSFFGRKQSQIYIMFQDPASVTNYYKAFTIINHSLQYKVNPISDNLDNGITIQSYLRSDSSGFNLHDTIFAELDVIDQPMYNYWNSFNNSTLSTQAAAPANPTSNISNNGLGYFSAYSSTLSRTIVIDSVGFHRIN